MISWGLRRFTKLPTRDVSSLLDLDSGYAVHELAVRPTDWVAGRTLGVVALRDEGVVVLAVSRQGGGRIAAPTGRTVVRPGDVLILYGRGESLRELDERLAGPAGDAAHHEAVAEQARRERDEERADRTDEEVSRGSSPR